MYKKALLLLMILAILTAGFIGYQRYQVEKDNQTVELVLDLNQLQKLKLPNQINLPMLLDEYRKLGGTSLALSEANLEELITIGEVDLVTDTELKLIERILGHKTEMTTRLSTETSKENLVYIIYETSSMRKKILDKLDAYLGKSKVVGIDRENKIIAIQTTEKELFSLPMGLQDEELRLIIDSGFKVVPRFSNKLVNNSKIVKSKFDELSKLPPSSLSQVIFTGDEVLGYPNYLSETKSLLIDKGLKLGIIEPFIAFQKGVNKLAVWPQISSIRVHSAQQGEFEKLSVTKMVNRYVRAVKERGVRTLYLKPILKDRNGQTAYQLTDKLINSLVAKLETEGYNLGAAEPISKFSSSKIALIIINLGVLAALFYLLEYLFISEYPLDFSNGLKFILFLITAFISIFMIFKGYLLLNREVVALLTAILFPTLAISTLLDNIFRENHGDRDLGIKNVIILFGKISLITIGGGVLLTGALGDWRYMLKVRQFRGVKLAFVGPLILFGLYYLHYKFWINRGKITIKRVIRKVNNWLDRPFKLKDLLLLIFLAVMGIIYIGRTGNNPLIPVPNFEIIIRHGLERIFSVRPRFKSFLIGHPLMILGIWLIINQYKKWGVPLIFGGLIGQITMINTLSHIHTPLIISSLRVGLGILLGTVIGLLLISIVALLIKPWQRLREGLT
ncbi:DUF5693 family protein [Selenihalanaerobacter shriftii]|uniref:Uncharacterized protein n=1 Tax=Selenihalanaerobacter shriftii TaxID=142842 RepID=A0A1T4KKS3_9FIRM|nr:DUF5693 family protein [Selenihalanaerobacter shriftii]SJZ42967.1 hypothetical protein SAMN02745118_00818 [Selenihalanaerobacter shriftii]